MDVRDPEAFPDPHRDTAGQDSADELLTVMTVLQQELARSPSLKHTFDLVLPSLLKLSDSAFGFIGETRPGSDGAPMLVIRTLSDISWDPASQAVYQQSASDGVRFERLKTLYGAVLTSRQPVIANDPPYDPRSGGLPTGHPPLRAFLGVPLEHGGEMVGMVGLANRPGGYDVALLQRLAPLFAVMGTLIGLRLEQGARQAAEDALRRSEALYRTTFEMAAVGIAQVDLAGCFIDVNSRLARKLGRSRDELQGQSMHAITHPDDLPPDLLMQQRLLAGEIDRFMVEKRYLRPDGSVIWAMLTVALVRDAEGRPERYIAVIEDLTERRLIEQRLRERDDVLRKISRFVPGVMFQLQRDTAGRFGLTYASEGIHALLDGPLGEPAAGGGTALQALLARIEPDDLVGVPDALSASADALTAWNMSFRLRDTGPSPRWFEARSMPERQPDGTVVWYGFIADITERKRYETALISAEAAERANRAKTVFLSRMSHELRTPLNSVLGFAQLLRMDPRTPLAEAQRQQVSHIERAGAHLLAMVNDILDIARVESGTLALQLEAVPVDEVVDDTLALLADMAHSAGVTLQRDDGGMVLARVDRLRLKQVLVNLLSNAIKFNQRGGLARVAWQRELATGAVCISVTDSGPGLDEAQMQQLFEPFNRLGAERSRVEGTGIGLVITRGLLESMDGALDVQSTPGLGSRFTAVLPAA
ncbi:MAG TPA: PAS domain S-box protein [Ideonella sp.]|nr:PAS domain S-box protein [Ideonella sp.]